MDLYSLQFILLVVITVCVYYVIDKKYQWMCLLGASFLFYCWFGSGNLVLIFITGMTTWLGTRYMMTLSENFAKAKREGKLDSDAKKQLKELVKKKRKIILFGVLSLNFGILIYIKSVLSFSTKSGLLLPLGISFYTFQTMGYLIDVYHEKYEAEKNFGKFMLFMSFFPQMIQGPINRFDKMKDQFFAEHSFCFEKIKRGMYQIFYGLLKKYVIANTLAPIIVMILDDESDPYMPGAVVVIGILLYSIQQYADFSGGIDMVMGIAKLFDIEMAPNFRQPYFSTSLAEFWRRWHISLGSWMRDYVFYPFALTKPIKKLGKWANNRFGKHLGRVLPAMLGNILVFLIVGLWHGFQLNYVLWGLYNGVIIAMSDLLAPVYAKLNVLLHINTQSKAFHVFRIVRTFTVVNVGWYFDRIENIHHCIYSMIITLKSTQVNRMVPYFIGLLDNGEKIPFMIALLATCFVFFISVLQEKNVDVYDYFHQKSVVVRWGMYYVVSFLILLSFINEAGAAGFLYANF